jgi:LPS export ABC transporter permease LptG/LPS export ABC transporter permease LptF
VHEIPGRFPRRYNRFVIRTLDRYLLREVLPPFLLALLLFTFILQIPPLMDHAEALLAKGVPVVTVAHLLLLLTPSGLGIAIPMALLVGLLIAFGRLSGDRETVAMLACGISLYRLLRPVMLLSGGAAAATMWVLLVLIPDANQTFREITYDIVAARAESDVRPGVFFEDFPARVLYVQDQAAPAPGWRGVFLADTSRPARPVIFLAERGRLVLDRATERVDLVLENGMRYSPGAKAGEYDLAAFREGPMILGLDPRTVFPKASLPKGISELTIAELRAQSRQKREQGLSTHNETMFIQQKFSIPAACVVFGLIGLALGVTARRDGKFAGFAIGLAVIFVYYILMYLAESLTKGHLFPAVLARWAPNIVLAPIGIAALVWRARWAEGRLPFRVALPRWLRKSVAARADAAPSASTPAAVDATCRRKDVVLVVRVPKFWYPRLTILDRYVGRAFVSIAALAAGGLLGIFYIASFVDLSDKLFKGQATGRMLLEYFWFATPQFIYYVIPLSVLVAALVTIGLLTKTSELTVMKACGVSLYRVSAPLLAAALGASAMLFILEEHVLASANRKAEALNDRIRGRSPRTFNVLNRRWLAGRDGSIYHYAFFDPERAELASLSIYEIDRRAWRLARHTFATRARHRGGWIGTEGWVASFDRGPVPRWDRFAERALPLEPPDYFRTEHPDAELMSFSELRHHVAELRASGFNAVPLAVALQRKLAFPFVTLIMTLIALPFGVTTGRRGAVYGIGLGIVLAIVYWLLLSAFGAVGSAGVLPPLLAAWAPNLLFGMGALYLLLTVRT